MKKALFSVMIAVAALVLNSCSSKSPAVETKAEVGIPTAAVAASPDNDVCLSAEEMELYNLIMSYRKSKNLPVIPISKSLTIVAQAHSKDLQDNRPDSKSKCNLHSWTSQAGQWKGCCYTDNHKESACMWDKPRELSQYPGDGYEIAANYYENVNGVISGITAKEALKMWKQSSGHDQVMANKGIWKKIKWNAIGIGIYKEYATVWFGRENDPAGAANTCN